VTDLSTIYRRYLEALNERRFEDLDQFVHDQLTYNDSSFSREQYASMLEADVAAIPDLRYDVQLLVVSDDHVAARLWFDCTPRRTFLGIEPNGSRAAFAEHVFYRFREGRIEHVSSLLDTDAIRRQLT
jgi:steroid delta-isomerase-like uncharacterized protein